MLENYLSRFSYFKEAKIKFPTEKNLKHIVVIPAYDEINLIPAIQSLIKAKRNFPLEVIVVFNASLNDTEITKRKNNLAKEDLEAFINSTIIKGFCLHALLFNDLPPKHAGVGLARKIGMDEALHRFRQIDEKNGIIICFDADSQCDPNYLEKIKEYFESNPRKDACSIYFEHPISGEEFSKAHYQSIAFYEMHLRYYKNGLDYCGFPFAFHTIGSSMAVRAKAYIEQGGMNRRKAGEDFYFLQKFISIGTLGEINSTRVIPSSRASHRVPFGTGRAIEESLTLNRDISKTYALESFQFLKKIVDDLPNLFETGLTSSKKLSQLYSSEELSNAYSQILRNSKNFEQFEIRFFKWFNAFQVLKAIHLLRDTKFKNKNLLEEVPKLLISLGKEVQSATLLSCLDQLRSLDRVNFD